MVIVLFIKIGMDIDVIKYINYYQLKKQIEIEILLLHLFKLLFINLDMKVMNLIIS